MAMHVSGRRFLRRAAPWAMWAIVAAAFWPFAKRLDRVSVVAAPEGSASALASARLSQDFGNGTDWRTTTRSPLLLVMRGLPSGVPDDSMRAMVRRATAPVVASGRIHTVLSPATSLDTLLHSGDRHSSLALVTTRADPRDALPALRALTAGTMAAARSGQLGPTLTALSMLWTGEPALLADLKRESAEALQRSELRALPLTLLVAWWAFGGITEALLAIAAAVFVVITSLGVVGALSSWWPATPLTASLVSVTGFALGVDYQLIVRRAADSGTSPRDARRLVAWAAALVATSFLFLALLPTGEVRGAAVAGAVTTLLAAIAASLRSAPTANDSWARSTKAFSARGWWRAWSRGVVARAGLALVTSVVCLTWIAWPVTRLHLASPVEALLPARTESMLGLAALDDMHRSSTVLALTVLVDVPRGVSVFDAEGWDIIAKTVSRLRAVAGAARVDAITTIGTGERVVAMFALPDAVQESLVSRTRQTARITVFPADASLDVVRQLAVRIEAGVRKDNRVRDVVVSGLPVLVDDVSQQVRRTLPSVVAATMVASFLLLLLRFRAPLLALKAVCANLLVAAAAMGLVVRIFQEGTGAAWIGMTVFPGIFPTVPLLVFVATFGISMDYELLLWTAFERSSDRARQAGTSAGGGETVANAVAEATADVGGLIARSAALTSAVCCACIFSGLPPLAMVGAALTAAVVLDATVVRLILVPSWLVVAARWNWWPQSGQPYGGLASRPVASVLAPPEGDS